ncbi:MAG: helix-turn-helix transcriptional regulator [Bacteroidales bacterium]|nr:helix-turn-helix transcriptional regulator [Bacteroidales bacterium]
MSLTPFYLVSGLVCLFWIAVHSILARHTRTYVLFCYLFGAMVVTSVGDVLAETLTGSDAIAHLIILLMAPTIIPFCCLFFYKQNREIKFTPLVQFWIIIPSALFTAALVLTLDGGLEAADALLKRIHDTSIPNVYTDRWEHAYYLVTVVIFRAVMIAEGLFLLVYSVYLQRKNKYRLRHFWDFLFLGRNTRVQAVLVNLALLVTIVMCLKVFLHPYFVHLPVWSIVIALVIAVLYFLFGLFALFGAKTFISLRDIDTALRFNYSEQTQEQVLEYMVKDMSNDLSGESLTRVLSLLNTQPSSGAPSLSSVIFNNETKSWAPDSLEARFQNLMQRQKLFLQPGLSLSDVADKLRTNKTYVSKMVNKTYGLGFPEVLNIMRVDYAGEYIHRHPEASQEEIAKACGFLSASSFNSTFKRITGYTPKVWAASNVPSGGPGTNLE